MQINTPANHGLLMNGWSSSDSFKFIGQPNINMSIMVGLFGYVVLQNELGQPIMQPKFNHYPTTSSLVVLVSHKSTWRSTRVDDRRRKNFEINTNFNYLTPSFIVLVNIIAHLGSLDDLISTDLNNISKSNDILYVRFIGILFPDR